MKAINLLKVVFFSALIVSNSLQAFAERNPVGEKAPYSLDKDRDRTSRTIRDGNALATVPEKVGEDAFKVNLNYKIKTTVLGTHSGNAPSNFPEKFFGEQFFIDLRESGHYEDGQLKIDHLGMGNVRTMNGVLYENCDFIKIYDIKQLKSAEFYQGIYKFAMAIIMQASGAKEADVENLEIRAAIKYGLPVLGAAKIDVSGKVNGINLKAGFDYAP